MRRVGGGADMYGYGYAMLRGLMLDTVQMTDAMLRGRRRLAGNNVDLFADSRGVPNEWFNQDSR